MITKRTERIEIYEPTTTEVEAGVVSDSWALLTTVWANRKNPNMTRQLDNGQDNIDGSAMFTLLFNDCPTLSKKMKLKDAAGIEYRVTGYQIDDGSPQYYQVLAAFKK